MFLLLLLDNDVCNLFHDCHNHSFWMCFDANNIIVIVISRKTCPCNEYPLIPDFYMAKLGLPVTGVYLFSLFLFQNIDCEYSLEPPQSAPTICVLSKNKKNIYSFSSKMFKFSQVQTIYI